MSHPHRANASPSGNRAAAALLTLALTSAGCGGGAAKPGGSVDPNATIYDADQVQEAPELISCGDWIDHGVTRQTWAVVGFVVTAQGNVQDPRVTQVSPRFPEYGVEALRLVRSCQFRPAMRGGEPVAVRWSKRFDFTDIG